MTPGYFGNYALRRSIRLDPPYWTTILFVLLLHAVLHLHLGFDSPLDVPTKLEPALSWELLASQLCYLQNILRYDNLSAGFWTLCIEVQFYILYVFGLGIAQRFPARNRRSQRFSPESACCSPAWPSRSGLRAVGWSRRSRG